MTGDLQTTLRSRLRGLYFGSTPGAIHFRIALVILDLMIVTYFIAAPFFPQIEELPALDLALAVVLTLEYAARIFASARPFAEMRSLTGIADAIVIGSLWLSPFVSNLGFLRILRTIRLFRSYRVLRELREYSRWFRANEEIIVSTVNLLVFIFIVTALVYVLEVDANTEINTYLDALYFTVTTLTTTGFGDITLTDTPGRLLAVVIMMVGVALFLRLVQTIFRPTKVRYRCPSCGLARHDPDAVHCKHCGEVLNIPTDGDV